MTHWLDDLTDEMAALAEYQADPEPIVWARALRRDHGQEGAVAAVLGAPNVPPAVRRIALEELAR
jgi:hypothetical protein